MLLSQDQKLPSPSDHDDKSQEEVKLIDSSPKKNVKTSVLDKNIKSDMQLARQDIVIESSEAKDLLDSDFDEAEEGAARFVQLSQTK